jgi:AraC-like DNA-binding protein
MPVILTILSNSMIEKKQIYLCGAQDYINYPIMEQELNYRVTQALNYLACSCQHKDTSPLAAEINPSFFNYLEVKNEFNPYYQLAQKTAQYLDNHLASNIQLNSLAAKMGTNRNKLSKAFNTYFGTSVIKWLRNQRMEKARELLRNTNLPIQEVAYQVSYDNAGNFSSVYRREFSLSPRQERQLVTNSKVLVHNSEVLLKEKS